MEQLKLKLDFIEFIYGDHIETGDGSYIVYALYSPLLKRYERWYYRESAIRYIMNRDLLSSDNADKYIASLEQYFLSI